MDHYLKRLQRCKLLVLCITVIIIFAYYISSSTNPPSGGGQGFRSKRTCNGTQEKRLRHLSHACRTLMESGELVAPDLEKWREKALTVVVLEKERSLFCFVPKVACSSWKTKLLTSRGVLKESEYAGKDDYFPNDAMQDVLAKHGIKSLSSYKSVDVEQMLNTFYKFIFVRHPLDRLLSAYTSKMSAADGISQYYLKMASDIGYKNSSSKGHTSNRLPTYEEFATYVSESRPEDYDLHWKRFSDICNPCGVGYDFVGRLETMEEDAACVLGHLGMDSWFPQPPQVRTSRGYQNLPEEILNKVRHIYGVDGKLFDYEL